MSRRGRATFETMVCGATYELRSVTALEGRRSKIAAVGAYVTARSPAHTYPGDRDWICDVTGVGGNVVGRIVVHPSKLRHVSSMELLARLTDLPSASGSSSGGSRPPAADPR